jgi:hypothetical protein
LYHSLRIFSIHQLLLSFSLLPLLAKATVSGATSGLNSFLIKPNGLSGESLFRHMVPKRLFDRKVREHHPSSYLEIEFNSNQIGELGWSTNDLKNQRITCFAGGHGATTNLAKRKLDSLG